jgi:hypothetical protein
MLQRVAAAARNAVKPGGEFDTWDDDVKAALLRRTFATTPREAEQLTHLFFSGDACFNHNTKMSTALPGPVLLNPSTTGVVKAASVSRGAPLPPGRDPDSWWGRECRLSGVEEAMWDTVKKLYPDDPWSKGVFIKVGSRLMITSNVDIENGLVNGALCTVTSKVTSRRDVYRHLTDTSRRVGQARPRR